MAPPMVSQAKISLFSFLAGSSVLFFTRLFYLNNTLQGIWESCWLLIFCVLVIPVYGALKTFTSSQYDFKIAVRAGFLGCAFSLGTIISMMSTSSWQHFGWYLTCLSIFHWSEYFTTAVTNPKSLTLESYLLDHSREYKLAAVASWVEFSVEWFLVPGLKQFHIISIIGFLLVIFGEVIRKASMITASTNFNHYVQYVKQRDHELVTHGVYAYCRHPSYVGWFVWSIGTQIILCNPVCLVVYVIVSWRFFKERIMEEEIYLLSFFGEDYIDYQKKVGTGLPFIYGYKGNL